MLMQDYAGRHIFIHDGMGNSIANSTIETHNREYMTVQVKGRFAGPAGSEFVSVLILAGDGIHEYKGKIRHSTKPLTTELALFKGKITENRTSKRYAINTIAGVERISMNDIPVPLQSPLTVLVVNLSTSGVLLRAVPGCFAPDSILSFRLNIGGKDAIISAQVVRVSEIDTTTHQYGCMLISAE